MKLGRCIKELERIYGIQNGNNQYDRVPKVSEGYVNSQEQLADMIGISVDTLSNYKKLTELVPELQDWVETGILAPTTAIAIETIIDIMEWMINTQLGRRNFPPAQRLAVMDKFRKKIQEQAATKASESRSKFHGNQHVEVCSPNGAHTKIKTDKELAKMAGTGTVYYHILVLEIKTC